MGVVMVMDRAEAVLITWSMIMLVVIVTRNVTVTLVVIIHGQWTCYGGYKN